MHYVLGPLKLHPHQRAVFWRSEIIPLAPKTFDLLLLLVANAGEVVSRETLRESIWPDSFVEEAVISRSISLLRSRLRPHLGDEPFIETIPKRGYRYTGEVQVCDNPPASVALETQPKVEISPNPSVTLPAVAHVEPAFASSRNRVVAILALAILLSIGLFAGWRRHAVRASSAARPSIAILNLQNLSGQDNTAWLGIVLQDALGAQLSRDHGALVADGDRVNDAEHDLGIRDSHAPTSEETRDLGRQLGSNLLITGSYLDLQNNVRVDLALYNAATGKVLSRWNDTVARTQLPGTVQRASANLRASMQLPPAQGNSSLPILNADQAAAQFYAEGVRLSRTGDNSREAAEAFAHAIQAEPQFPQAHVALSLEKTKLGDGTAADSEAHLALNTSANLPAEDRLLLQATAYSQLADYSKAIDSLSELHRLDPHNPEYTLRLARELTNANRLNEASDLLSTLTPSAPNASTDARVPLALAEVSSRSGDLKAVLLHAGQAFEIADKEGSRSEKAQALLTSGIAWGKLGDFDRSITDLKQAEDLYTAVGNRAGVVNAILAEATAMQGHDNPDAAATAQRALLAAQQTNQSKLVARAMVCVGNIQLTHDQEADAAVSYKQAIALAQAVHGSDIELNALSNLGTAEYAMRQMDLAASHTQQALEIARAGGVSFQVARCTDQLAEIERYRGELASAETNFRVGANLWRQLGQTVSMNDTLYATGEALMTRGKLSEARDVFQSIDVHAMSLGNLSLLKTAEARLTAAEGNETLGESMAADSARTANSVNYSVFAMELQAALELRRHDLAAARITINEIASKLKLIPTDKDAEMQHAFLQARFDTEAGNLPTAQLRLQSLSRAATQAEDKEMLLRIKLAQGQLNERKGQGTSSLQAAVQNARQGGFELLARSAS